MESGVNAAGINIDSLNFRQARVYLCAIEFKMATASTVTKI